MLSLEDPFPTNPGERLSLDQKSDIPVASNMPHQHKTRDWKSTHIQLSVPHNGNLAAGVLISIIGASDNGIRVNLVNPGISLLARNFNNCWCMALNANPRPEFFVMHHSDIMAERGWLDKLVRLMDETGADIISCNVPIKDGSGELSTAVFHFPSDGSYPRGERVRLDEATQMPETFTMKDLEKFDKYKGGKLLVNTGLWICRFRDAKRITVEFPYETPQNGKGIRIKEIPWIENFFFHMIDSIVCVNGKYEPHGMSEDWQASIEWDNFGLDYRATNAVKVYHFGNQAWEFGGK